MLYNFIPVISLSDYKKRCHSKIDVIFRTRQMTNISYDNFHRSYGLKLPDDEKFYQQNLNSSEIYPVKVF